MNKACRSEELDQHQYYLTLTYLNVVWPNVEGCHQALQEISDPSEVGASNAPGAVHQQHDVCCCIAVTLKWFPWRHTLINRSTKQIVLKRSEFRDLQNIRALKMFRIDTLISHCFSTCLFICHPSVHECVNAWLPTTKQMALCIKVCRAYVYMCRHGAYMNMHVMCVCVFSWIKRERTHVPCSPTGWPVIILSFT